MEHICEQNIAVKNSENGLFQRYCRICGKDIDATINIPMCALKRLPKDCSIYAFTSGGCNNCGHKK